MLYYLVNACVLLTYVDGRKILNDCIDTVLQVIFRPFFGIL